MKWYSTGKKGRLLVAPFRAGWRAFSVLVSTPPSGPVLHALMAHGIALHRVRWRVRLSPSLLWTAHTAVRKLLCLPKANTFSCRRCDGAASTLSDRCDGAALPAQSDRNYRTTIDLRFGETAVFAHTSSFLASKSRPQPRARYGNRQNVARGCSSKIGPFMS